MGIYTEREKLIDILGVHMEYNGFTTSYEGDHVGIMASETFVGIVCTPLVVGGKMEGRR